MLRKLLLIIGSIAVMLIVAGCASSTIGNEFDDSEISKIKTGISTKEDVLSLMGAPYGKNSSADGTSIWSYQFTKVKTRMSAKKLIPVVGWYADSNGEIHSQNLRIAFDKKGVVKSCTYKTSSSEGKTREIGRGEGETVELNCENVVASSDE